MRSRGGSRWYEMIRACKKPADNRRNRIKDETVGDFALGELAQIMHRTVHSEVKLAASRRGAA